ncbi:hypothetical protein B0J13DRAFT_519157 [Dactylonectria estremocensis]|uniref:DOMON domain-containing protein n=1 Tax=Dactylonectria estremocensis TaxID=1079267 RepID=A0A9P9FC83_9HYPO|nr:hypothetical protein B0J13DRAFT_519157 [Dactylonectria estremocensis]
MSKLIIAVILLYTRGILATTSSYCPNNQDACFRWGVPKTAASSGSGDVYVQIKAPTSYQWVGLGIGSRMAGAEMFLVYQDGNGNVTLSTRTCTGHNMPQYTQRSQVELLDGSGVSNEHMVANFKCADCSGLDLSGSNSWIAGWKQGSALDSTDPSQSIQEHDGYASFQVDFALATFSSNGNPFTGSSSGSGSGAISESSSSISEHLVVAHGVIMAIVFVIAYPVGAILMPILGKWMIHAGWQVLAFLSMWVGFGIGYAISRNDGSWGKESHVTLGVIICALLGLQPILGWAHHVHFVKHKQRGMISHAHIWYGRVLMILGIINGGIGLQLASAPSSQIVAYSIVVGVVAVAYITSTSICAMKKARNPKQPLLVQSNSEEEDSEPWMRLPPNQARDQWTNMEDIRGNRSVEH